MTIESLREKINTCDREIVELFKERMACAGEIGQLKKDLGNPVRDRQRENDILDAMTQEAGDFDLPIRVLFETLFAQSRQYQQDLIQGEDDFGQVMGKTHVTYPFPEKASIAYVKDWYSETIVNHLFNQPQGMTLRSHQKIVDAVDKGLCDFGLLPIEDNQAGAYEETYQFLLHKPCHIVRDIHLDLTYDLIAPEHLPLDKVKVIYCDDLAARHCNDFLNRLDGVQVIILSEDELQKALFADHTLPSAFILPSNQNTNESLITLRQQIANRGDYLRYICIAPKPIIYPDAKHMSLIVSSGDVPGGLNELLAQFAALNINLTLLESRPIKVGSDTFHRFFIDLETDLQKPQVQKILGQLHRDCSFFRFLGAYTTVEAHF